MVLPFEKMTISPSIDIFCNLKMQGSYAEQYKTYLSWSVQPIQSEEKAGDFT